ncbi:PAS domain S-box protein [Endothiovibrio diazotrophicus]
MIKNIVRVGLLSCWLLAPLAAVAATPLEQWRDHLSAARQLAENDGPRAYHEAERLVAEPPPGVLPADRVRALNVLARAELYLAKSAAAGKHAEQALALAKANGDRIGRAEADLVLALNTVNQARIDALVEAATDALTALDGVTGRPDLISEAMLRVGMMYRRIGRLDDSVTIALQAKEMAEESGDPLALVHADNGLAYTYDLSGHHDEAAHYFEEMGKYARLAGSRRSEAAALLGVGSQQCALKRCAEGEKRIREAIGIFRRIGGPFYIAHALYMLADTLRRQGRGEEARPLIDEIVEIYSSRGNRIGLWWTLKARSGDRQAAGDLPGAWSDAERSYGLAKEIGLALYLGGSARRMAAVAAGSGDHRKAYRLAAEALALAEQADRERAGRHLRELTRRYREESHQRRIDELTHRNQLQAVKIARSTLERRWLITLIGASLVILVGVLLFLRQQRRANRLLSGANVELALRDYALDRVGEAAFLVDRQARLLYVNEEACRSLGYGRDELSRMTVMDIDPDWSADRHAAAWEGLKARSVKPLESLHRRKDGTLVPVEVSGSHFEFGGREFVLSLVRDITERKRTEAALRASEERYRQVFENSPVSIWEEDFSAVKAEFERLRAAGVDDLAAYFAGHPEAVRGCAERVRIVDVNRAAVALHEAPDKERLLAGLVDTFTEESFAAFRRQLLCLWDGGRAMRSEAVVKTLAGERREVAVHFAVCPGVGESLERVLVSLIDITERKAAERRLRQALEFSEGVINAIPDLLFEVDVHGRYLNVWTRNPELLVAPKEALLGRTIDEVHSPEAAADAMAGLLEADAEGLSFGRVIRIDLPGGSHWFELSISKKRVEEPLAEARFLVLSRDITQRVRAELALVAREREFHSLAENIPDHIVRYDLQARKTYLNSAMARLIGIAPGEVLGLTPEETPPKARALNIEEYARTLRAVLADGEPRELETPLDHAVEGRRTYSVRFVAERDEGGGIVGALMVGRDITARKHAEEALAARERQFRTLAESLPDNIVRYDRGGRARYVNPVLLQTLGRGFEDRLGQTVREAFPGGEFDDYARLIERVLASGEVGQIERVVMDVRRGMERIHQIRVIPERDERGELTGVLAIGHDITELKEAERQMRRLTAHREAAREEERKRIAREVHDELGQLLTALRMNVSLLRLRFGEASPPLLEHARRMMELVDRTLQVVRDVAARLRPAALDMGIGSALEWLAGEFSRHSGLPCEMRVDDGEIALEETRATAVFRIAQESLTNVARHAGAGRVWLTLERRGAHCLLEVRDDGVGFDPALGRRNSFGLVGLRERAQILGGELEIDSAPGRGTTVTLRIPVDEADA